MTMTYYQVHYQLRRTRGRAAEHVCQDCGGQASSWAWTHQGPWTFGWHGSARVRWGQDLSTYVPLCGFCHQARDRDHGAGWGGWAA